VLAPPSGDGDVWISDLTSIFITDEKMGWYLATDAAQMSGLRLNMTNMPRPAQAEVGVEQDELDRSAAARQRAAAVFRVPDAPAIAKAAVEKLNDEMFMDVARTTLPIEFQGKEVVLDAHAYEDDSASYQAMALVHRQRSENPDAVPLVRVHSGCVTGDIFHSLRCDCYAQLQLSLERIIGSPFGVIIYLPHHEGRGIGLVNKIKAYAAQDRGLDTVDANLSIGEPVDARDYVLPAKILKDLRVSEIRLMSNNPLKVEALERNGIKVVEQVKTVTPPSPHNKRYLETKRERMSHNL
jgi:GTP cyclohydrolase II/3,4-dihydroxy 2-butanone 4-phosphate synthase/GTP cyclohydrolase II